MKYVSIDIETTGIDKENDQILEVGAIIEDTLNPLSFDDIPKFKAIIRHDVYRGNAYAINLNKRIFKILAKRETFKNMHDLVEYDDENNIIRLNQLASKLHEFLHFNLNNNKGGFASLGLEKIKINVAGKNFNGFDKPFLLKVPSINELIDFEYRSIDPAGFYTDFKNDEGFASLNTCLKRAGINKEIEHNALSDAWHVILTLRPQYERELIFFK